MSKYIMALDSGTTSCRTIIFNAQGDIIGSSQREFRQYYPHAGWVEHDAVEIWHTQLSTAREALINANVRAEDIAALGITNQRETAIVWDKLTGRPVCRAIVWQCRRTADYCDKLKSEGYADKIRDKTGLVIDAYFSAAKLKWILDNVPNARVRAENGELLFGTIDTWLIWNLTGGKVHVTDCSNASRTMLCNIEKAEWDNELLELFDIPRCMLPEIRNSSEVYGVCDSAIFGCPVPVAGAAGDQQAALFGQTCYNVGDAKNTYGTGCFLLMNTGSKPVKSVNGLVATIAWNIGNGIEYALEGSVFIAGAAIQWLRDEVGLIASAPESESHADKVSDTNGCYFVPAFTGLGAPYWDPYARGCLVGLTRGVNRDHIIRAVLESLVYQSYDVIKAMADDLGLPLTSLKVDGGACANNFLMQFQADIVGIPVKRPKCVETTALGAAYLAGLAVGYWKDREDIIRNMKIERVFIPDMSSEKRSELLNGWHTAVGCSQYR